MVMTPREARWSRGITAKHMALALGISYKSLARKERGETQWKSLEEKRFLKELNLPRSRVDFSLTGPLGQEYEHDHLQNG